MKLIHLGLTLSLSFHTLGALAADPNPEAITPSKEKLESLRAQARELIGPLPEKIPGAAKDNRPLISLGRKLFFDNRLSQNNTISCNSCHVLDNNRAGVDNQPTSPGAFGKRGDRNSPTVLNAGFHFSQFWDGRATNLEEQAKGPVLNPIEMAMPDQALVLERLQAETSYPPLFKRAFPGQDQPISYDNVAKAIAAFERTLITRDRFDDFQKGRDKALTALEVQGLETFLTVGCTTCHFSPVIGGNSFQKVGLVNPYENTKDIGLAGVTQSDDDKFKFKVPSLRNVALTGPYFHDGQVATLKEAVQQMGWMQLGLKLDESQTEALVAFLTSLSDKTRVKSRRPVGSGS